MKRTMLSSLEPVECSVTGICRTALPWPRDGGAGAVGALGSGRALEPAADDAGHAGVRRAKHRTGQIDTGQRDS